MDTKSYTTINLTQSSTCSHSLLFKRMEVDLIDAIIKGTRIGNIKIGKKISFRLVLALKVEKNVPTAAIPNKESELVKINKKYLSETGARKKTIRKKYTETCMKNKNKTLGINFPRKTAEESTGIVKY